MTVCRAQPALPPFNLVARQIIALRGCGSRERASPEWAETAFGLRERQRIAPSAAGGSPGSCCPSGQLITIMNQSTRTDSNVSLDVESALSDPAAMIAQRYQLYVERIDASKNMARYYAMTIEPNLFGEACLIHRWGRIGARGQRREHHFAREEEAVRLFLQLLRKRRSRGYRPKPHIRQDASGDR